MPKDELKIDNSEWGQKIRDNILDLDKEMPVILQYSTLLGTVDEKGLVWFKMYFFDNVEKVLDGLDFAMSSAPRLEYAQGVDGFLGRVYGEGTEKGDIYSVVKNFLSSNYRSKLAVTTGIDKMTDKEKMAFARKVLQGHMSLEQWL